MYQLFLLTNFIEIAHELLHNVINNTKKENMKRFFTMWQLWAGIAIILAILLISRGTGVISLLPFALLLICPIMMMFMMGGHGDHKHKK